MILLLVLPVAGHAARIGDITESNLLDQAIRFFTFRDPAVRYALLGSMLLGISCGLLGSFLVVRKMALVGDALSHAVESYLSKRATQMSSFIALESMRRMGTCLSSLRNGSGFDFNTREQLLYASLLAGIVIAQTGTTALHAMGYSLTYFKKIEHGRANGLLIADYLQYLLPEHREKVMTVLGTLGLNGIADLRTLIKDLLGENEGITEEEVGVFSEIAMKARNIPFTLKSPSRSDLERMFRNSFLP
jgi:alcohol dehydrogenase class IV